MNSMFGPNSQADIKAQLTEILLGAIKGKIPPMAKMLLGENIEETIKDYLLKHQDELFDQLMDVIKEKGMSSVNVKQLIQTRIDELDFVEFEEIIFGLMKKELKHVEIIGLFLGAMIGVIQYLVTYFL